MQNENRNNCAELNELLFETLRDLKMKRISPEEAKSISGVAQTIINAAKIEVDYAKAVGNQVASQFLPAIGAPEKPAAEDSGDNRRTDPLTGLTVIGKPTVHRMK